MSRKAYTEEYIELQGWDDENGDPKVIKIHPLVVAKFRKLSDIMNVLFDKEKANETSILDTYMKAVAFCMETFEPELSTVEELEKYATWPDLEYILDVVAGIKLNDPNQTAATVGTSGSN